VTEQGGEFRSGSETNLTVAACGPLFPRADVRGPRHSCRASL